MAYNFFRLCKWVRNEQSLVHRCVIDQLNIYINGLLETLYVFLTTLVWIPSYPGLEFFKSIIILETSE